MSEANFLRAEHGAFALLLIDIGRIRQRWDADGLAGSEARIGLHPAAIDAHLAGTQQLVQLYMVDVRPAALEETVNADAVLAIGDI